MEEHPHKHGMVSHSVVYMLEVLNYLTTNGYDVGLLLHRRLPGLETEVVRVIILYRIHTVGSKFL